MSADVLKKSFASSRIKVSLDLSFLLFALLLIYLGSFVLLLNYVVVLFLHEYAHAYMAKRLGYSAASIKVSAFGVRLNMKSSVMRYGDEIKIALAGPLINVALAILCLAVWWVFPITYNLLNLFCLANIITAILNLIPAHPLDGGRVLWCLVGQFAGSKKADIICTVLNILISATLFVIFFVSLMQGFSLVYLTYLFMGAFILISAIQKKPGKAFDYLRFKKLKQKSGTKIKSIIIDSDTPLFKVLSFVGAGHFLHFLVLQNGAVVGELYESDLEQICEDFAPDTAIGKTYLRLYGIKAQKQI